MALVQKDRLASEDAEALGFLGVNGDAQIKLTSKWDPLPAPTASLLAVAHRSGWLAAGGPDSLVLATTKSARDALRSDAESEDSKIRPFTPQIKLDIPGRITHVAFTSDEKYLVVSSELQGGLNIFDTQSLFNGSSNQPSFQVATNGEPLRSLAPNPAGEFSGLVAIVTTNGNLLVANLSTQSFEGGNDGILQTNTSCVTWSTKGKQLVAGLADGQIVQMTPSGQVTGQMGRAPDLQGDYYVDNIAWLENRLFLVAYVSAGDDRSCQFRLITRGDSESTFQPAEGLHEPADRERVPHNVILRLRDFPPSIKDMLIVSSSVSPDVGVLTRPNVPANQEFAVSIPRDEARRAAVPQNDDWDDTWIVGASLDLSSTEKVSQPLPDDPELEESPEPVPGYWILNHEGALVAWWVISDESIRHGTVYSGMASQAAGMSSAPASPAAVEQQPPPPQNAFGGSSNATSPFGQPSSGASPFGAPNSASPFGSAASKPAFGSSSGLGQATSPWGSASGANKTSSPFAAAPSSSPFSSGAGTSSGQSGFGSSGFGGAAPAFGSSSALGKPAAFGQTSSLGGSAAHAFGQTSSLGGSSATAFGQSSGLGTNKSPWASGTSASPSAFGQSGFGSAAQAKPFGSSDTSKPSAPSGGGFASFANTGGFGSLAPSSASGGQSIFAQANPAASFKSDISMSSSFGGLDKKSGGPTSSPFGQSSSGLSKEPFKLGTTFKRDPNAKDDEVDEKPQSKGGLLGSAFGSALSTAATESAAKEVDMEADGSTPKMSEAKLAAPVSNTPTTTPAPPKFSTAPAPSTSTSIFGGNKTSSPGIFSSSSAMPGGSSLFGASKEPKPQAPASIFGSAAAKKDQASPFSQTKPSGGLFGNVSKDTPGSSMFGSTKSPGSIFAQKPDAQSGSKTPEKPKVSEEEDTGDKVGEDAPLPPDFVTKKKAPEVEPEPAPLPPDPTKMPRVPDPGFPPLPGEKPTSFKDTADSSVFVKPAIPAGASSIPSVPDDLDDDEFSEAAGESEGSGVDVAKDLSPPGTVTKTPGYTPQSSFGGIGGSAFSSVSRPEQQSRLFGEMGKNAPVLPKPPIFPSPRSPSPVRGVPAPLPGPSSITNLRNSDMRSVSAPGMASQILGNSRMRSQQGHGAGFGASITGKSAPTPNLMEPHLKAKARKEAEESQILVDDEDDQIQRILASEVIPTTHLDEFIAHSNVRSQEKDQSIPAQVEAVYRDINSMIDTIGLNARSLVAFVEGHSKPPYDEGRGREDLEDPDGWVLCEIDDLNQIVDVDLTEDLESGRVRDVDSKKAICNDLSRDLARLRARQDDLRKIIMATTDPDTIAANRALPLSSEQSAQQAELRKEYMAFSKMLAEVEEALVVLKTKVATAAAASGRAGLGGQVPTVDAIMRTIQRMTSMAEKRSGDIDVLETQMRKLRFSSLGANSPRSREGSPFVGTPGRSRPNSSIFSPGRSLALTSSVMSVGSGGRGTPRKKLSGFTDEEKKELMERRKSRREVLNKVKRSLEKAGPKVIPLEE